MPGHRRRVSKPLNANCSRVRTRGLIALHKGG